jgi:hypothetical protein
MQETDAANTCCMPANSCETIDRLMSDHRATCPYSTRPCKCKRDAHAMQKADAKQHETILRGGSEDVPGQQQWRQRGRDTGNCQGCAGDTKGDSKPSRYKGASDWPIPART